MIETEKQQNVIKTRQALYDIAIDLFEQKGFSSVKVEDITKAMGVSKGTFYTYFKSKADILFESYELVEVYYNEIEKEMVYIEGEINKIKYLAVKQAAYIEKVFTIENMRALYICELESGNSGRGIIENFKQEKRIIRELIIEGKYKNEITEKGTVNELLEYVMNIIKGFIYNEISIDADTDLYEKARKYYTLSFSMLKV